MAQAVVNPLELRRFAQTLKEFNENLRDQSNALTQHLQSLSESWRDQENKKFTEEFQQHLRTLQRFLELNQQHIPYLMRKADRIEEYLQQR